MALLKQKSFDPAEWKQIIESTGCENFNVLFGDLKAKDPKTFVYSSETRELVNISDLSLYSLANSNLQRPKQQKGKELITELISTKCLSEASLFSVLQDETQFSEDSEDFTKWPIFVRSTNSRGTVSSTLLTLDYEGTVEIVERSWTESSDISQERRESFVIN